MSGFLCKAIAYENHLIHYLSIYKGYISYTSIGIIGGENRIRNTRLPFGVVRWDYHVLCLVGQTIVE